MSRHPVALFAEQGYGQPAPPPPPPQPAGGEDRLAQLERLGQLQAQGVLSPEEFAAEKARILGS